MSKKSANTTEKQKEPRSMEEIQNIYKDLCLKAGQAQYQVAVIQAEIADTNRQLLDINQEAAARNELDKENKKDE